MNDTQNKPSNRMQLAGEVAQQVQIHAVDLVELACRNEGGAEPDSPLEVSIETATSFHFIADDSILLVDARCVMNAGGKNLQDPVVQVAATFRLVYQISDPEGFTDEHYAAFAEINGMFNLWPYWRELVQNVTLRMGLPPLTLPVRRGVRTKKDRTDSD